jgi:hypothetical protein
MRFQRQGCVLSNDYEELSIVKTESHYIPLRSRVVASVYGQYPSWSWL